MPAPAEAAPAEITFIGLGKMGIPIGGKLVAAGYDVAGWDPDPEARDRAASFGILVPETLEEAIQLQQPADGDYRKVWQMTPASRTREGLLAVAPLLGPGDIVVDAGNSHPYESDDYEKLLGDLGLRYLGIGVSGGVRGAISGLPQMVGGHESAYDHMTPMLDVLAAPGGSHAYFGPGGSGHFVKALHNGGEYPEMQAFGEITGIAAASDRYSIDLLKMWKVYQRGSLLSGFMADRMVDLLERTGGDFSEYMDGIGSASGDAVWTADIADDLGVPAGSIKDAIEFRRKSKAEPAIGRTVASAVVQGLRAEFGGHGGESLYIK